MIRVEPGPAAQATSIGCVWNAALKERSTEHACLIANSLNGGRTLETRIVFSPTA